MKKAFIDKYKNYYKARGTRNEIFGMIEEENDPFKDYEERFQLSYKRNHSFTLDETSFTFIFLIGIIEELMEILNLITNSDIFQLEYEYIKQSFKNYSKYTRRVEMV